MRLGEHADLLLLDVHRIDELEAVTDGRKRRRGARLERIELAGGRQPAVLVARELHGLGQHDDADVVEEERILREERMRVPLHGFDRVGSGERIVVVAVLDVGLGEDAQSAELARLTGAVARGQHHFRGDQRTGATERGVAADVHDNEHDGRMAVAIERPVGNGRGIGRDSLKRRRGDSVAPEQRRANNNDRDRTTNLHGTSLG